MGIQEELKERLDEISEVVNSYNTHESTAGAMAAVAFLIIGAILTCVVGEFWAMVLVILAALPIYFLAQRPSVSPNEKQLSQTVCLDMEFCVKVAKLKGKELSLRDECMLHVSSISYYGNEKLYEQFIKYYPQMASAKLKKLASVKIGI